MHRSVTGSLGLFLAVVAFSPIAFAQASKPEDAKKTPAATSPAKHLTHNLSGVWMQYADGTDPAFPRMNGVDDRTRPPLTLSLIHISEPTRQAEISYAVFCLKKKK